MNKSSNKLAYPIDEAFELIGATRTRGYQLIAQGKLKTFRDGKRRKATHKACEECVELLAKEGGGHQEAA